MYAKNAARLRAITTTSSIALSLAIVAGQGAYAQTAAPAGVKADADNTVAEIVVGTRASLQSAIGRKKRAQTIVDSLVAEDVASFPDKNVGEALQRITGVQLSRDFGEGKGISIRGIENDLNRVETNGVSKLGFNGGRGSDFREMASELIKTVDVYKGSIASLTEGGVGGTVVIQTMQPLDLKKPLLSFGLAADYLDSTKSTNPRGNLTFGRKFLDDRLGILVNMTYDEVDTRSDSIKNNVWLGGIAVTAAGLNTATARGGGAGGDFDQSPEKTYSNPLYASAASKSDCVAKGFATAAELPPSTLIAANPQTGQGGNAAQFFGASRNACLAQWNDYIPQLARYGIWTRNDKRFSGVGTIQFRVTDNFDIYAEYSRDERRQFLIDNTLQLGITNPNNLDLTTDANGKLVNMKLDSRHNVIDYRSNTDPNTIAGNGTLGAVASGLNLLGSGSRGFSYDSLAQYVSGGFNYSEGPLQIKGLANHSWNHLVDETNAINLSADVPGSVRITLDERGNPQMILPAGFDLENPAIWNRPGALNYRPTDAKITEDMAKVDFDLDVDRFGITKFEWGGQVRKYSSTLYANGAYVAADGHAVLGSNQSPLPVLVSSVNPVANNGKGPSLADYIAAIARPQVWTPDYLAQYVKAIGVPTPGTYHPGGSNGPDFPLMSGWLRPDFANAGDYFDLSTFTRQYLFTDPQGYAKAPNYTVDERTNAIYGMVDYSFEVLGRPVGGNFGVRFVRTKVAGIGLNSRAERRRTTPTCVGTGCATTVVTISSSITPIEEEYSNTLPSVNMTYGIVPDRLIASFGYAKQMARPKPNDIVKGIVCTFDVSGTATTDNIRPSCTAGNPDLNPYLADEYDVALAWYPNQDTLVSAGFFYKDISSYILPDARRPAIELFRDGVLYDVTQPINGTGAKLKGLELSAQTAFTFLPAPFDGFGLNVNYTYTNTDHSNLFSVPTGEEQDFVGLSKNSYNIIGYYDKGPYNVRVAYNYRQKFNTGLAATASGGQFNFVDSAGYLDAKFTYRVPNSGLSLSVEGKNLTGETQRVTQSGDPMRMATDDYSGKRYFVGLAWKF